MKLTRLPTLQLCKQHRLNRILFSIIPVLFSCSITNADILRFYLKSNCVWTYSRNVFNQHCLDFELTISTPFIAQLKKVFPILNNQPAWCGTTSMKLPSGSLIIIIFANTFLKPAVKSGPASQWSSGIHIAAFVEVSSPKPFSISTFNSRKRRSAASMSGTVMPR